MKKTTIALLIAALAPALGFAQGSPATPTPSLFGSLASRLRAATTLDEVANLEKEIAADLPNLIPTDAATLALSLSSAYQGCASRHLTVGGYWTLGVIPKYAPDWDNSTALAVRNYYMDAVVGPVFAKVCSSDIPHAKTPAELDSLISAYFAKNIMPDRFQALADSRLFARGGIVTEIAKAALRVGHPEALPFAIFAYRTTSMASPKAVDDSVARVAAALKAKDMNLTRANTWIGGQNTGTPAVAITDTEKAIPTVFQPMTGVPAFMPITMDAAKAQYRVAGTSGEIDAAIYAIATALKAQDMNLARANAWIKSQKDGTAFDLP